MKVVVLGGYGVFGSLLCELLVRDGHQVWVAGRNYDTAKQAAARIGAVALRVDITQDLGPVFSVWPDVVVDAVGPFQAYGGAPYRLAEICIRHGVDYFDLSDDARFTAGISRLNDGAVAAGCRVLSGASSVPGLSSAVVAELARGMVDIDAIETVILPGNRAPRGRSVIASILSQVGARAKVWRGGQWYAIRGWSARKTYDVDRDDRRAAYFITVPDILLFPKFFKARSVMFRAGLELSVMNVALAWLSAVRRFVPLPTGAASVSVLHWLAGQLVPLGSDRSAMILQVTGALDGHRRVRHWRLIAEAGAGPYIPTVAIRTLLRRIDHVAVGARPCLAEFTLAEAEASMADLAVTTDRSEAPWHPMFQTALEPHWPELPTTVKRLHSFHDIEQFSGLSQVVRGPSLLARIAAMVFGFPRAGEAVAVRVTKSRTATGETWTRDFAGKKFRSYLSPAPQAGRFHERFGPMRFELDLDVRDGAIAMPVRRGWFLGIPVPAQLLPVSNSREFEQDGVFQFDVSLSAPFGLGLIVRYRGFLAPD